MEDLSRLAAETGRCVACGLCLPLCPTYRKTQLEADSPRGRIMLTQAIAQGTLHPSERFASHIDLCLSCRTCESVCPNHVPYGSIIDEARSLARPFLRPTMLQRFAAFSIKHRALLSVGGYVLRLAHALGLGKLFSRLPVPSRQYSFKKLYAVHEPRGEVALFLGCVSHMLDAENLAAAVFLLNRLGYNVHIPHDQTCCGGLHRQMGESRESSKLEKLNHLAFAPYQDMPVVGLVSGCTARLLEFMSERVLDISAFLDNCEGWDRIRVEPLPAKIAVQDACSLRNVLNSQAAPYRVLRRIPDAEIVALPGNEQCCGGAGSYPLTQPEMAGKLLDDKIKACNTIAPHYVATSNIGCALHLGTALSSKIVHPVWLLAKQSGFDGELE